MKIPVENRYIVIDGMRPILEYLAITNTVVCLQFRLVRTPFEVLVIAWNNHYNLGPANSATIYIEWLLQSA